MTKFKIKKYFFTSYNKNTHQLIIFDLSIILIKILITFYLNYFLNKQIMIFLQLIFLNLI